jgi:CRP/FNR family transcriptional regulator, nitrogen oxide reductase regulator
MTHAEAVVLVRGLAQRFLDGLTPSQCRLLFEAASLEEFEPGSLITRQGFPAGSIALLIQGCARFACTTLEGRKLNLRWIYPGEICGLAALLSHPHNYLLSSEVVRASVALIWKHAAIRSFAAGCPRLIDNGLTLTFDYIRLYQISHICATSQTARQRLALVLGAVAEAIGRKEEGGIEMDVRNEDLANDANLTVFTASRLLNEWQREGILVKTRGKILLRSPQALLRFGT